MPYANPEDYKKWLNNLDPEKRKQYNKTRNTNQIITKRCPECRKQMVFRKTYASYRPYIKCKHCGEKIKITKTLSDSNKNSHGIKLEAVA